MSLVLREPKLGQPVGDSPPRGMKKSVFWIILFVLFFLIALGLGYPVLNRYDPRQTPGLSDVQSYSALVTGDVVVGPPHLRFRVLVPWIARPFYRCARGRLSTWDPVMFGLLCSDSLFVAATALLLLALGIRQLGDFPVAFVASLLYLLNFAVPNLRLAGLVDAGEGFFLLALLWGASEQRYALLPIIAAFGALTKESFVPLSIAFTLTWWIIARKDLDFPRRSASWIASSWIACFLAVAMIHWRVAGEMVNPIAFTASFHRSHDYISHFASSLWDRNLLYIFAWLLPMALPKLRSFPRTWLIPTAATAAMVFVLDSYYGAASGTVGRELFSVAGPVLSLSAASFFCGFVPRAGQP